MYLTDFDEDNPPEATHSYEADRLLGRGLIRFIEAVVLLWVAGVPIQEQGVLAMWGSQPWWLVVLAAVLYLRALWPLLQAFEHGWIEVKRLLKSSRFTP